MKSLSVTLVVFQLAGLSPPDVRTEDQFDAGSIFHVATNYEIIMVKLPGANFKNIFSVNFTLR